MTTWYCSICGKQFEAASPYRSQCSPECDARFEAESRQLLEGQLHALVPKALRVLDEEGLEVDEDWGVVRKGSRRGVYFVQAGDAGPVKIGVSADVDKRITELQVSAPSELRLLAVISDAGADVERRLHTEYADELMRGEWYRPCERLMALVQKVNDGQWISTGG